MGLFDIGDWADTVTSLGQEAESERRRKREREKRKRDMELYQARMKEEKNQDLAKKRREGKFLPPHGTAGTDPSEFLLPQQQATFGMAQPMMSMPDNMALQLGQMDPKTMQFFLGILQASSSVAGRF